MKPLSSYPLEQLIETYQIDLRPTFKHKITPSLVHHGLFETEYVTDQWQAECWPRRIKEVYGATPREAVEKLIDRL